jgi:PAS domain S-box-containing protein
MIVIVHLIGMTALVGYFYDAHELYAIGPYDTISLPTASSIALLSAGYLAARPDRGITAIITSNTPGGVMVRRLLPVVTLGPAILGCLVMMGQRAGIFNTAFAASLDMVLLAVVFAFVVLRNGRSLFLLDRQRLQAKRILVENEKRFRALLENSEDAISLINDDGKNIYSSPSVTRILGHPIEELAGHRFLELLHPQDREKLSHLFVRLREQPERTAAVQYRVRHKDGSWRWLEGTLRNMLSEPAIRAFVGNYRDITDRKNAENALRESEERFKAFMSYSPAMTWIKDERFRHVFVNTAFEQMFGISLESMLGKTDFDFLPEENAAQARANDMQVFSAGMPMQTVEVIATPDGRSHQLLVCKFVFHANDGRKFIGGIGSDITKLKQTEESLALHIRELARSNAELQQFANVASHDLQEPLRMVAGYLQLLERRYKGKLDADADEYIDLAVGGARRMKALIEDLLSYSRVGAASRKFEGTSCDAALQQALNNLQFSIADAGARLTHDPLPSVKADGSQLVQLFQNLIGNAIKFRSDKSPEVHIGAELQNGEWVFSVRDNGIGIDTKHADRLFKIFKRVHNRNVYPGNGIGLAICKKIVESHCGRIWAESQAGKGATIYFTIPASPNG